MSKESILKEFEEHKGQFVIDDNWEVKRLIAVLSDKWDYYWVYWDGRDVSWGSCVGGFVPLKDKVDEKDYNNFIRLAKLNHYDQYYLKDGIKENKTKETLYKLMTNRIREEKTRLKNVKDEYLTEICWDLN